MVDTAFSYERELIVCSFLLDFPMGKGSSLQIICNTHTAFSKETIFERDHALTVDVFQFWLAILSNIHPSEF